MRLLVSLKVLEHGTYDLKYYHKLQGFLYNLLEGTPYHGLHDQRGYKFFCFSNLFPTKDMSVGETRRLLVSCPNPNFIHILKDRTAMLGVVHIGNGAFRVIEVKEVDPIVKGGCVIATGTPIVVRIPKEKYAEYGLVPEKPYPYLYWRKQYSFTIFLKQLEDNLRKKYMEYHGSEPKSESIFEQFAFKKQVCNHITMDGVDVKVLGSNWEFIFDYLSADKQKILQFGLDCGFGELNSMGFGFMNICNGKRDSITEKGE